jgi:hypothetical protein
MGICVKKYEFEMKKYFSLDLPKGATILEVVWNQVSTPVLYALGDYQVPCEKRNFCFVGLDEYFYESQENLKPLNYRGYGFLFEIEEIKKKEK